MNEQLMLTSLSLFIALMAFAVSALTFYFVHFKKWPCNIDAAEFDFLWI